MIAAGERESIIGGVAGVGDLAPLRPADSILPPRVGRDDFPGDADRRLQHGKAQFRMIGILVREAVAQFAPAQPVVHRQIAQLLQFVAYGSGSWVCRLPDDALDAPHRRHPASRRDPNSSTRVPAGKVSRLASTACRSTADNLMRRKLARASEDVMVADAMGGRVHVRWDDTAQATPHGQIVFFAESWPLPGCLTAGYRAAPCTTAAPTPRAHVTCWAR
jgi:hypothetical protein